MKIIFIAPRYHTNQTAIVKNLLIDGHQVRFLSMVRGKTEDYRYITPDLIPLMPLSRWLQAMLNKHDDFMWPTLWGLPKLNWLHNYLIKFKPDVVIVRNPNQLPFLLALMLARALGYPVIVYTQGPQRRLKMWKTHLASFIFIDLLNCAWMTPINGNNNFSPFHSHAYYVPCVVDSPPAMEQRSYSNGGPIRILSIGKFVPRKNHLLLLKALSEIVHLRSFHLTLVGEASSFAHQSYVKLVQKKILALGLSPYVTILTNVPFRHMSNLYMNNDVFVIPSRDERLSVALVEAMAHGLSVLAGTGNAAAEYIHVGKNGFVFLKENLEDLISKLLMMTASRHQSQQMGEQSLILARQFHHPAIFHKKLKQIIKSRWGISLRS